MALDLASTTAESLRTMPVPAARQRLVDLLGSPEEHSDLLQAVLADRGLRDALMAVSVQTGRMDDLRSAAEVAMAHSILAGQVSWGAVTMLAITAWADGANDFAHALASTVPEGDSAHRMANLVAAMATTDMPVDGWLARVERLDVGVCLAFRS